MNDMAAYNEKELFPPVLAVDFDGTLVENKFPEIGAVKENILTAVLAYQAAGWRIILWTCRTDEMLQDAVEFCKAHGLVPDEINRNIPEVQAVYGGDTRKVFANMYIDDRNGFLSESKGFTEVLLEGE